VRVLVALIALSACSFHGTGRPRLTIDNTVECTSDIGLPIFDTIVAVTSIALGVYVYKDFKDHPDTKDNAWSLATPFAFTGVLAGTSAVYGYRNVRQCHQAEAAYRKEVAQARERRKLRKQSLNVAWTVTKEAMTAARSGDCAAVEKLDTQVRNLDEDFYTTVFRQDVAIARCMGPLGTPAPQPEPARTQPPSDEERGPVEVPPPHQVPLPVPP
jgi:hypothetical protein